MSPASSADADANTSSATSRAAREPVTAIVEVVAKRGHEADALVELREAARRWESEPDCMRVTVLRDEAHATRFMVLEEFASTDALERHASLDSTREFLVRIADHMATPARRRLYPNARGARVPTHHRGRPRVAVGDQRPMGRGAKCRRCRRHARPL